MIAAQAGGFLTVGGGGLWLDNVLVRQASPPPAANPPALVSVQEGGKMWLTRAALQGDGSSSCTGISAKGPILVQGDVATTSLTVLSLYVRLKPTPGWKF